MLTVSSLGGGLIIVSSPGSTVLFQQPASFQILLGGQDSRTSSEANQIYDLATSAVSLTQTTPTATSTQLRTLLPTINSALAFGMSPSTYLYAPLPMRAFAQ